MSDEDEKPVRRRRRRRRRDESEEKPKSPKTGKEQEQDDNDDDPSPSTQPKSGWDVGSKVAGETPARSRRNRGGNAGAKSAANWNEDDDDSAIPIIPVLEEEAEEESLATVASAPVEQRSLPTARQLNGALIHSIPTSTGTGVDMSVLTKVLAPYETVQEVDEHWEFDTLLQRVAIEMQEESEKILRAMNDENVIKDDDF